MSSYDELQDICDKAFTCRSEEEAFEIIERLRPYLRNNGHREEESNDQPHVHSAGAFLIE
jgi:hypothetical protein